VAVSHRGGVRRLAPAPAAGEARPDEQAQAHGEPRDPIPTGARAAMPASVLLLSGRRRRGEPPAAAGASGGLRLLVPTAAAAPTAPVGGLGALGGEREEAVAEAGRADAHGVGVRVELAPHLPALITPASRRRPPQPQRREEGAAADREAQETGAARLVGWVWILAWPL